MSRLQALLGLPTKREALILPCGGKKREEVYPTAIFPVSELYTGSLWTTYRNNADLDADGRNTSLDVFVLSAEYGLLPEDRSICSYDRVLVSDSYGKSTKDGTPVRRVSKLVPLVSQQAQHYRLGGYETVWYEGSRQGNPYYDLLTRAGIRFRVLPGKGRGIGYYLGNLKRFLRGR